MVRALGVVLVLALVPAAAADVPAPQRISADPFTNAGAQHETAVEPDSFSFGRTVVATFQVGRIASGAASGIGWATSKDDGSTWASGVLPSLTVHGGAPAGSLARASDPAVAYDRVHGVWLISVLGIREASSRLVSSLLVSRSADGLSWSAPAVTSPDQDEFLHDKNWIACDNGRASPHAGRCYVAWASPSGEATRLAVSASSDGGSTWGAPSFVSPASGFGAQPLVRPDGTLVIVYAGPGVRAVRSTDGGRTFSPPVRVSTLRAADTPGMRAPAFHSGEVDAAGRISIAWPDCRYRRGCSANDLVLSSSVDGATWSRARRVPTGTALDGFQHVVPGLAVDGTSRGASARLGLTFYVLRPRGCTGDACSPEPLFVSSADGGRSWSAAQSLAQPLPLSAYPQSGARFLGDYISTSFVAGGVAVPVFAAAFAPFDGRYHQGVFATAIPPLRAAAPPLRLRAARIAPRTPRARGLVTVSAAVTRGVTKGSVSCETRVGRSRTRVRGRVVKGRAICTWRVPAAAVRRRAAGSITLVTPEADATRRFSFRVR